MFNSFKAALSESLEALDQTVPRTTTPIPPAPPARSSSPATSSASIGRGASPNTTAQSPSQLADSALSSLRQSFRRGSSELQRKGSGTSERGVPSSIREEAAPPVAAVSAPENEVKADQGANAVEEEAGDGTPQLETGTKEVESVAEVGVTQESEKLVEEPTLSTPTPTPLATITVETDATSSARVPQLEPVIIQVTSTPASDVQPPSPVSTESIPSAVEPPLAPKLPSPSPAPTTLPSPPEPTPDIAPELNETTPHLDSPASESVETTTPAMKENESRVKDITQGYKRLQSLKLQLDKIVSQLTPLSGVSDVEAFEGELKNMVGKTEMSMAEVRRLSTELEHQKQQLVNFQESARSETASLTAQVSAKTSALSLLNQQLAASEESNKVSQAEVALGLEAQEKLKIFAKEEEEKRVKAMSLLRALRQKLVKSEKDKEENELEVESLKASELRVQEMIKGDRLRFDQEILSLRAAQEVQLSKLRGSFERETSSIRAQNERELSARKGQYELDAITIRAVHAKELAAKESRIQQLGGTVRELTASRDDLFDQLQVKTAEAESSSSQQEVLQAKTVELQYELQEVKDRSAALEEQLDEVQKSKSNARRDDTNMRRLLQETEIRYEAKVRDYEARLAQVEKDRQETEEEMGRNLQERSKELERIRQEIVKKDLEYTESIQSMKVRDDKIEKAEAREKELVARVKGLEKALGEMSDVVRKNALVEAGLREELAEQLSRAREVEQRLEEAQAKESSLRSNNKVLRDELRKVQSGVLTSETQRHPGVGYFSAFSNQGSSQPGSPLPGSGPESSFDALSRRGSTNDTQRRGSVEDGPFDEQLNFEYLRNVILQFLERPDMRAHLVGVLGVILHFSPVELRRIAAKT